MNKEEIASGADGKHAGQYANYFKVGHNDMEFVLDFGQFYPDDKKAHIHSRIITNPCYAKVLLELLQGSINQHEQTFGEILQK
jgi:hypothetical protein